MTVAKKLCRSTEMERSGEQTDAVLGVSRWPDDRTLFGQTCRTEQPGMFRHALLAPVSTLGVATLEREREAGQAPLIAAMP